MVLTVVQVLLILISGCAFIFAFVTGGSLISFLSYIPFPNMEVSDSHGTTTTISALLIDISLLCLFMFQHSAMAKPLFKRSVYSRGFQVAERSIYVIATSFVLQCMMRFWQPIPWIRLWNVDTTSIMMWAVFAVIHFFAWCVIYIGTLMMDMAELLGVKQVYYSLRGLSDPLTYKSRELRRLYLHMRHPSFTAFCILFWIYPTMSLDRVLLAGLFTIYMMVAWNVDRYDCNYQSLQLSKKRYEMSHTKLQYWNQG